VDVAIVEQCVVHIHKKDSLLRSYHAHALSRRRVSFHSWIAGSARLCLYPTMQTDGTHSADDTVGSRAYLGR